MSDSLQQFLIVSTPKAAADLLTALHRLPREKWDWSPSETARSAIDMVVECAMLGDSTEIVVNKAFSPNFDFEQYMKDKAELTKNPEAAIALLHENVAKTVAVIATVPSSDLDIQIEMPWGPLALSAIISYPYWNMSYHEGQINYIASILGCLQ